MYFPLITSVAVWTFRWNRPGSGASVLVTPKAERLDRVMGHSAGEARVSQNEACAPVCLENGVRVLALA
jgi:hypothetical protein